MNTSTQNFRDIVELRNSHAVTDGDGVKIQRAFSHSQDANPAQSDFDPFLLLDEIASDDAADYIGGFPEHPHRGFETVTYMLEGKMLHRDHLGNEGLLEPGSVQWMTAGKGVLHSEMPQQDSGKLHGFQLWVNLPAAEKMKPANYQEFSPTEIPSANIGSNSSINIIAGTFNDAIGNSIEGPVKGVSRQPDYFDVNLQGADVFETEVDIDKNVVLYVYEGSVEIHSEKTQTIAEKQLAILGEGDRIKIRSKNNARFLYLAALPIKEPVVQWGPFVMNTMDEVNKAIQDYRHGVLV